MNHAFIGICIVSATLLSACEPDPRSTRIVSRITSPDGTRDAIYAEDMGGGATVGPSENVYVVAKGDSPRLESRVFSHERVCNLAVRWLNIDAIHIEYSASKPLADSPIVGRRVEVQTKWLGPDAADGC